MNVARTEELVLTPGGVEPRVPITGYRLTSMDPAWDDDDGGGGRGANCKYETTSWQALLRAILESGFWNPEPSGAHVWMWQTSSSRKSGAAYKLADALGLRDTGFEQVWVKGRIEDGRLVRHLGLGQYGRMMHEYHRLYVVGADVAVPTALRPQSVRIAPARGGGLEHSEKPSVFYEDAYAAAQAGLPVYGPKPAVELFARDPRPGWVVWGNEVEHG